MNGHRQRAEELARQMPADIDDAIAVLEYRSRRADGKLSDMANLSWSKHAVLAAAERDISPPKSPVKRTLFETKSPYVAPRN
jgi:hypothetical protein